MTFNVLKIAIISTLALSFASTGLTMEKHAISSLQPVVTSNLHFETDNRVQTASLCAMDLMPEAFNIFDAVAANVGPDSNLKKLVKKNVRPKVFSGKLSIKSARKNAKAASICLRILKHGSADAQ